MGSKTKNEEYLGKKVSKEEFQKKICKEKMISKSNPFGLPSNGFSFSFYIFPRKHGVFE